MLISVWLTGWLLLVYTEGKLDWEVAEKITDYGQNLTLFCEVDKCCTEQSGWIKESLAIYLDIRIIADDPTRKYGTFVRANGFGLVIRKLNTNDINITYSCSYGFEISDPKLLQFDDVFIEEGPTTSLIFTTTAEHTTTDVTEEEGKSHGGEIVGSIVGGVIGVVVIIVIAVVFVYRRRSTDRTKDNKGCKDEEVPLQEYQNEVLDHKGHHRDGFNRFYTDILKYKLDTGVIDCLVSQLVLTIEDADTIRQTTGKTDCNKHLLSILKDRPYNTFNIFTEALNTADQIHNDLVNAMKTFEVEDEQPNVISAGKSIEIDDFSVRCQKNYKTLVDQLTSPDKIVDILLQFGTFTAEDNEDITSLPTVFQKNRMLLSKVDSKGEYKSFLRALKMSDDPQDQELAREVERTEISQDDKLLLQIGITLSHENETIPSNVRDVKLKVEEMETKVSEVIPANIQDVKQKVEEIETKLSEVIPANIQEVRLKVEEMETKVSEVIPVHIQDQIQIQLELWKEKDQMFVSTGATTHVLKCITENSCVTVTGNSGVGKTFIVRHVALIMKGEGYTVVPTCRSKDIRDFTKPGSKTLFVVDDIGGDYTLNQKYLDNWKHVLQEITPLLEKNTCKIIATCRLQVFKDEKFKSLSIFTSNECNLNSKELCLTAGEKSSLAKKYFGDQASKVHQLSDQYEFFPLLCSLYDKVKFSDLSLFFSKPFDCYKQELDHLLNEGDEGRYKYCVLALVVMFNNKLSEDHLSDDYSKIIDNTLLKCKLDKKGTSVEWLKDALHTLEGTFVVKDKDCYKTVHDKLFDFLANYFGDKMLKCIIDHGTIEFINERIVWKTPDNTETDIDFIIYLPDNYLDMYIKRLVDDWSGGKVGCLFDSKNFKSPIFIVKLLDHIKQHDTSFQLKLANVTGDPYVHDTTLLLSCFVGDVNLTQWILDNTVYNDEQSQGSHSDSIVNKCRDDGTSPVYITCQEGHLSVLDRLIECKADINKCTNDGVSPVSIACQVGHLSVLDRLIECKADINKCTNDGESPVYITCYNGDLSVLDRLIECKADINKCNNNDASPVYITCQEGHLSVLDRLIECKADINKCTNDGESPVYITCQEGHLSVLNRLIECKADINKCTNDGESPVYITCYKGHLSVLNRLIECKADINKCTNDGESPVYITCYKGHLSVLNRLIECKADINKCTNDGESPVYIACQEGHLSVLDRLIECKADINKCTNNGTSPVYIACQNGHLSVRDRLMNVKLI